MTQDDLSAADERPSKSQLKREMHELQDLGETFIAMKPKERERFPLSDEFIRAIEETDRIRAREARRRHMQYVGKLIRKEDLDGIQAVFDEIEQTQVNRDHALNRLEKWRDRLIEEGTPAIESFIADYPDVDRQALRQLIRNAVKEREQNKPPTNAKRLFKLIRETAGV
ncbi:ribosome biogenesis factor YjgA [Halomonas sp. V046]|uniref:ribosome biogenesis factor YjgA n=1 Tax=Halomonas sp. V046 TaxID=3459611 RepID=UPI004043FFE2